MIRRLVEFALDKSLLNHMFLVFIVLLSIFAYLRVPKEIFPPVQLDKVSISGGYAGASADVLDKMVVRTIEDELKNVDELDTVQTTIKNGAFTILTDIKPGSENVNVLNDVKDIIAQTKRDLPADMNEPTARIFEASIPLVLIAIAGDESTKTLLEMAEELKRSLSVFKDLSEITIRGDSDNELVFRIDPKKLHAYGLNNDAVVTALQGLSSIFPVGTIKQRGSHLYVSTYNGEKNAIAVADSMIRVENKAVRIGDIAEVSFELAQSSEVSHYNGQKNVSINITKSKSGNAIALSKKIKQMLKTYQTRYPHIKFAVYTDTSVWIKNRLNTVVSNILFGLMLVFAAMLIFVNRGIAIVVAMGVPLSFMIGLIAIDMMGYSLNMLSLLGALIALGMLVDEAIVVGENIHRHIEEGLPRREAAIKGAMEMFPAVLTATLTTIFAFLPMLILSGEMGVFLKILPIVISVLLISSLFEAFFFLPLHAHDFLRSKEPNRVSQVIWKTLYRWYDAVLHRLFRHRNVSLALIVVFILSATIYMAKQSKFQLFPEFDVTQIYVSGKVDINNDLDDTEAIVSKIEHTLLNRLDVKEFSSVTSVIGMRMNAKNEPELGEHLFHVFIDLHERAPDNFFNHYVNPYLSIEYDPDLLIRQRTAKSIAADVEAWLEDLRYAKDEHGALFEALDVNVPSTGVVAHDIEVALSGKSTTDVIEAIERLKAKFADIEGVYNLSDDADLGERELKLKINGYGQQLALNETIVGSQLRAFYLKGEYGKMFDAKGLVRIRMERLDKDQIELLRNFLIRVPGSNRRVALSDVCDFIYTQTFATIQKEDGERIRSVFGSLDKAKNTSTEVMKTVKPLLESLKQEGFVITVKGEEQESEKTKREMMRAAAMAIFLIFITLVWLFDSLRLSIIVLSTIPLVLLGVYVGHWIMGLNMTMPSMIGVIGLAGVVVNDGLIMVSFIRSAKDAESLMQQARMRLRPILMTSVTTVLGLSTLIFFASGQAKILQPMAISLGFGITWATVLNLLYVPLMYSVVQRVRR